MTRIMFRIENGVPVDELSINAAVSERLVAVINRAPDHEVASRYATGDEIARTLRGCHAEVGAIDAAF